MKKIFLFLILAGLCGVTIAADVVELKLPKSDKIVIKYMFRNGSICDPEDKRGITRLTASLMMDGGTGKYNSTRIKDMTYPWAAEWYATVDKEVVIFTFEFHKDHVAKFTPIMMGLLTNPSFSEDDFNRIKSNQQNYVNEVIRASSDEEFSKMGLEDLLFRGTNYQHMVQGTSEGIEAITLEDVKNQFTSFFRNSNLTIGIAGNYDAAYLEEIVNGVAVLGNETVDIPEPGKAREPQGVEVEIISKDNALGSAIFTGAPLQITRRDDEFAALMVANSWLGEHRKAYSRLYKKIRQERSMNYGDYSYIEWYSNGGSNMLPPPGYPRSENYFAIWIRPVQTAEGLKAQYPELSEIKTGHAHFAIRMAVRELTNLVNEGLSQEDFELTRDFLRAYMKLYVQTPERQLGYLLDSKFYGRKDYIAEMDALLEKLTLEQVNDALRNYIHPETMFICIVTDDSEATPLAESLRENASSPMSYSDALKATLPGEILQEDQEVNQVNVPVQKVEIVKDSSLFRD